MKIVVLKNVHDPYALYILWCRDQLPNHISWGQDPVVPGKTSTKVIFIAKTTLLINDRGTAYAHLIKQIQSKTEDVNIIMFYACRLVTAQLLFE